MAVAQKAEERGRLFTVLDKLTIIAEREDPSVAKSEKVNSSESEMFSGYNGYYGDYFDHPYSKNILECILMAKGQPIFVQDEENEDVPLKEENKWKPVKEVKSQFLIGINPLNPLISSFDVASIEEFNPDGSPVDKMHVVCSCELHGFDKELCSICTPKPITTGWEGDPALVILILAVMQRFSEELPAMFDDKEKNKENHKPQTKAHKRKRSELIDKEGNVQQELNAAKKKKGVKEIVMPYIEDLSSKKNKELKCHFCEKIEFKTVSALKNHYFWHGNVKRFHCEICGKSFTRKAGLNYHSQVHNNEFRFTCSICRKQFRHITHYKRHCLLHEGKGLLHCPQCSSSFKNKGTLKKHLENKHAGTELVEGSDSKNEVQMLKENETNSTVSQEHVDSELVEGSDSQDEVQVLKEKN